MGTKSPIGSSQPFTYGAQGGRTTSDTMAGYTNHRDPEPAPGTGALADQLKAAGAKDWPASRLAQLEAERRAMLHRITGLEERVGRVGQDDALALLERARRDLKTIEANIRDASGV